MRVVIDVDETQRCLACGSTIANHTLYMVPLRGIDHRESWYAHSMVRCPMGQAAMWVTWQEALGVPDAE